MIVHSNAHTHVLCTKKQQQKTGAPCKNIKTKSKKNVKKTKENNRRKQGH